MKYYQHKISREWDAAKPLFDMGYLTIGRVDMVKTNVISVARKSRKGFEDTFGRESKIWELYHFLNIRENDVIVVPLSDAGYAIVRAKGTAKPITKLLIDHFAGASKRSVIKNKALVYEDDGSIIDLGFYIEFEMIREIRRALIPTSIRFYGKHTWQTMDISRLAQDIKQVIIADKPPKKKVLMFFGYNKRGREHQLAEITKQMLGDGVMVDFYDYGNPFLHTEVGESDGVWFFASEFAYSSPHVIKSTVERLTEPLGSDDYSQITCVLNGKTVAISSIVEITETGAGVDDIRECLLKTDADVLKEETRVTAKKAPVKLILSEEDMANLRRQVEAFLKALDKNNN